MFSWFSLIGQPGQLGQPLPAQGGRLFNRVVQVPLDRLFDWLDECLSQRFGLQPELLLLLRFVLMVALVTVLVAITGPLLRAIARRLHGLGQEVLASAVQRVITSARLATLLLGLYLILAWANPDGSSATGDFLSGLLFVALVLICTRAFLNGLHLLLSATLSRLTASKDDPATWRANQTVERVTRKGVTGVVWLGALAVILGHFGKSVSSVITALGVGSLAIGLASQHALANMIAGVVLLMDRPFRVGDRIRLPGLDIGTVEDIGIRSTHIRLADGNLLIVPNTDLVTSRVVNYNGPQNARGEVRLQAPLATDLARLSAGLLEAAGKEPGVRGEPAPRVLLLTLTDKMELSLVVHLDPQAEASMIEEKLRREGLRLVQLQLPPPAAAAAPPAAARAPG